MTCRQCRAPPFLFVGGRDWDDDSIDCGVDVVLKQYDDFAFATSAWRYVRL
jgi:hypothetical protein